MLATATAAIRWPNGSVPFSARMHSRTPAQMACGSYSRQPGRGSRLGVLDALLRAITAPLAGS